MSETMKQCAECGVEYPRWCFERLGRGKKVKLEICQACQIGRLAQKTENRAEEQRKKQVRSRDNQFRYEETVRRNRHLWEDSAKAAAGDKRY